MGARPDRPAKSRLWWWIVAACIVHVAAWTAWFVIAAHHPVEEVPLAAKAGP
ncbi:MAG: hypothetical protein ABSF76_00985 [Opitutaceae bacterium]|jgi:hypothetical protein